MFVYHISCDSNVVVQELSSRFELADLINSDWPTELPVLCADAASHTSRHSSKISIGSRSLLMQGASWLRCHGGFWLLRRAHGLFDRFAWANSRHKWLAHEQMLEWSPVITVYLQHLPGQRCG